ncbi:MAG: NFACT RNA binding domain-containing protein [Oligoflexia bacterium]
MFPTLNWREIALCADQASRLLVGMRLDRIIIADRPDFAQGYLKNEWFLRFEDRKRESVLSFSVRPRSCYFAARIGKGPKASSAATRSAFDQALSKYLKGGRLTALRAYHRERIVVLEFGDLGFWLVLTLIPSLPEALLVDASTRKILARSRIKEPLGLEWLEPLAERQAPEVQVREPWGSKLLAWSHQVEESLAAEALGLRRERALREIREKTKTLRSRLQQSELELERARSEQDWQKLGETLKQWLYALPQAVKGHWELGEIRVPCGEGRTPAEQMEKLFSLARRKKRRIEEAAARAEQARHQLAALNVGETLDLSELEKVAGLAPMGGVKNKVLSPKVSRSRWTGRTYFSKEGLPLWVGRSSAENLELTFKIARGNDLWMHVRGRPGAHLVIPLDSGKSASLETLLDAAQLVIFHSGGKNWGKTEVDYTFKKNVKRIRDSTEASYVNNKTLIVAPDEERLTRLLSQQQSELRSN